MGLQKGSYTKWKFRCAHVMCSVE